MNIREKILFALGNILNIDPSSIDDTALLSDLGFNSIGTISFIVLIEEEFDIILSDDDLLFENFKTIDSIEKIIQKYISL